MPKADIVKIVDRAYVVFMRASGRGLGTLPVETLNTISRGIAALAATARPLSADETGIVTFEKPKTAALLADRVWLPLSPENQSLDFAFGCDSPGAITASAGFAIYLALYDPRTELLLPESPFLSEKLEREVLKALGRNAANIACVYSKRSGARISPLYSTAEQRDADYQTGRYAVVISVVENVAVVDEKSLTWDQVLEFRKDANARASYQRFVHWLDKEMVGKPASFICDEVNERLETYHWALRKHGLQTVLGALQRTIGAKSLLGTSAAAVTVQSLANQPLISALAGAGLLVGQAAIHIATALIEREDLLLKNRDVAFVHELHSRLGEVDTVTE